MKLDISKIIDCLAVDCPYELYWYEKTSSYYLAVWVQHKDNRNQNKL